MEYFRVRNWDKFQHYKDRDPPWIKLHFSILSSSDWVSLDDKSRVLAVACMLIASKNHGVFKNDPEYIKRVAYLKTKPNFKPLIDCGFLQDASECKRMLAKDTQEERREEKKRGEKSREEEKPDGQKSAFKNRSLKAEWQKQLRQQTEKLTEASDEKCPF